MLFTCAHTFSMGGGGLPPFSRECDVSHFFEGAVPPPLHKPPLNVCLGVNIDVYLLIAHY